MSQCSFTGRCATSKSVSRFAMQYPRQGQPSYCTQKTQQGEKRCNQSCNHDDRQ